MGRVGNQIQIKLELLQIREEILRFLWRGFSFAAIRVVMGLLVHTGERVREDGVKEDGGFCKGYRKLFFFLITEMVYLLRSE